MLCDHMESSTGQSLRFEMAMRTQVIVVGIVNSSNMFLKRGSERMSNVEFY